jgi:uncharacterized protein
VSAARRRRVFLLALTILVALLVGGRWLALETAERAWAATIARGNVYLAARDLARLTRGIVLLVAVLWGTANFYYVYRAIGSVQLPRRLGDLEIVEAVPQRVLLAGTLACGIVYGVLLALGTGDWWLQALLASRPPSFGISDPVLHRDLGYYLGELPWAVTCKNFALLGTTSAALLVALLYVGIGSLRFHGWRPEASAHARSHLGLVLALLALTLVRAAMLDPAEAVAGLHGNLSRPALEARSSGAHFIAALGVLTVVATLIWGVRERPRLLVAAWATLLLGSLAVYTLVPGVIRNASGGSDEVRDRFEQLAFGSEWIEQPPGTFSTVAAALSALPTWDADRVATVTRRTRLWGSAAPAAGAALVPPKSAGGMASWLVVPGPDGAPSRTSGSADADAPDWVELHRGRHARAGRPFAATEVDTGLTVSQVPTRDSAFWFGPGFREFAVAAPDTWPVLRRSSIPIEGWWRRTALAWTLQSLELMRAPTDGLVLLWRRDVADRLTRLAPFATFDDPTPVVADMALWWISYGYLESGALPLARSLEIPGGDERVRYLRTGLIGVVNGATGDTRIYLAPSADSLATAWARLLTPLIRPRDSLPTALREQLPYPRDAFRVAAHQMVRSRPEWSAWRPRPRAPYELAAPADSTGTARLWMAQAFDSGSTSHFTALLAGTMSPAGPRLLLWRPAGTSRFPRELLGSPETAPGLLRLWIVDGALLTEQALFVEPASDGTPRGVSRVYLTWGERASDAPTVAAAARNLLASGAQHTSTDTTLAARWELAHQLAARADSAAAAGDLEAFGRFFGDLKRLLGVHGKPVLGPERR